MVCWTVRTSVLVEQIHRPPVPALADAAIGGDGFEGLGAAIRPGDSRPGLGKASRHERAKSTADTGDGHNAIIEVAQVGEAGFEPA